MKKLYNLKKIFNWEFLNQSANRDAYIGATATYDKKYNKRLTSPDNNLVWNISTDPVVLVSKEQYGKTVTIQNSTNGVASMISEVPLKFEYPIHNMNDLPQDGLPDYPTNRWIDSINGFFKKFVKDSQGNIIAVGTFDQINGSLRVGVAKFIQNDFTQLDPTFCGDGSGIIGDIYDVLVLEDDSIIIVGDLTSYTNQTTSVVTNIPSVIKLNPDGSLNEVFLANANTSGDIIYKVDKQSNGQIIIAGGILYGGLRRGVARINQDGTLDETFNNVIGNAGTYTTMYVMQLAIDNNDKIYFATQDWNDQILTLNTTYVIACLNSDGSLDTDRFYPDYGFTYTPSSIFLIKNKILVAGAFDNFNNTTFTRAGLIRLNMDGTWDNTFKYDGKNFSDVVTKPYNVIFDDKDRIILSVETNANSRQPVLYRLTPDGELDYSFYIYHNTNLIVESLYFDRDNKIIVCFQNIPDGVNISASYQSERFQPKNTKHILKLNSYKTKYKYDLINTGESITVNQTILYK